MQTINMFEAKSTLSRLVATLEAGHKSEIIIARNGRPAARLLPMGKEAPASRRIGIAKGRFTVPANIDAHNADVAKLFAGVAAGA